MEVKTLHRGFWDSHPPFVLLWTRSAQLAQVCFVTSPPLKWAEETVPYFSVLDFPLPLGCIFYLLILQFLGLPLWHYSWLEDSHSKNIRFLCSLLQCQWQKKRNKIVSGLIFVLKLALSTKNNTAKKFWKIQQKNLSHQVKMLAVHYIYIYI